MLKTAQPEKVPAPAQKAPAKSFQLMPPLKKYKTVIIGVLAALAALALILALGIEVLQDEHIISDKARFKKIARSQLEHSISNEYVTFESLRFESAKAQRFKTREQDPVGYFAHIEGSMTLTVNTTQYKNYLDYYRTIYGADFDPEDGWKWAYTFTGSYKATHKEHGAINGSFSIVYVDMGPDYCMVQWQPQGSEAALRQDVITRITGMLVASYELQGVPSVKITSIDKRYHNNYYTYYTIYGVITVKDKYGDTYSTRFDAEYSYNKEDQVFQKDSINIGELIKNR